MEQPEGASGLVCLFGGALLLAPLVWCMWRLGGKR